jgi:methyl-accepting chemotaxis protein
MIESQPTSSNKFERFNSKPPPLKSVGTRLFVLVMTSAIVGLGSMAYLFYNQLKSEVEAEIRVKLNSKVNQIDGQVQQAEVLARSLRDTVEALHQQGIETPETYIKLTFELFKDRPPSVVGVGMAQNQYGVLSKQKWFFPYYYLDPGTPDAMGKKLAPPYEKIRYVDENEPGDFYPETDYWKQYYLPQKPVWADPYEYSGVFYTTFYTPIYDDKKKWLGGVGVDLDAGTFNELLKTPVVREAGYFSLFTDKGQIITYPLDPQKGLKAENFKAIPGLDRVWSQLKPEKSGLLLKEGNYWAYERIPSTNWIAIASVPADVVLAPVILISVGGTLGAGFLLAVAAFLATQYLSRRLKPILDECNRLVETDELTIARMKQEDEIGRLDISFFNLTRRLAEKEEQIRQEVERTVKTQSELVRAAEAEKEGEILQEDVGQLLDVVAAVEEGDLTVQAPVNDRVTGLVSDTFNRLIENLAQTLSQVLSASRQVSTGTDNLAQFADAVANNAERQAQQVEQVLTLSERVEQSAESATQQLQTSNKTLLALDRTVLDSQIAIAGLTKGTEILRQGSDRIVQQMKTLGEFAGLAEQLVQDQNQIATQTQVLALNASLVAARAFEQQNPKQFAVVAQEFEAIADRVSKLAQQTNEGLSLLEQRTSQIQNVVASVNAEVQNLGELVGRFTKAVDQSTETFNNVQAVTANTVQAGEAVTRSSQDIIETVRSTAIAMRGIAELAQRTAQLTQDTRVQSRSMGQLSTQLLERMEFFQLPAAQQAVSSIELEKAQEKTIDLEVSVGDESSFIASSSHQS